MGKLASAQDKEPTDRGNSDSQEQTPSEKPEPDEKAKEAAAEMMTAYKDRPTLVLPGTGGAVAGTAVDDWLDEDGNPNPHRTRMRQRPEPRQPPTWNKTRNR